MKHNKYFNTFTSTPLHEPTEIDKYQHLAQAHKTIAGDPSYRAFLKIWEKSDHYKKMSVMLKIGGFDMLAN